MFENHGVQVTHVDDHNVVGVQEYLLERNNELFQGPLLVLNHMDAGVTNIKVVRLLHQPLCLVRLPLSDAQ